MVEFFGAQLEGMAFTEAGWTQSYGSRCVRAPIVVGDVSRRAPMAVAEFALAQGLTPRPVKGMLTGPVTILNWSFPRKGEFSCVLVPPVEAENVLETKQPTNQPPLSDLPREAQANQLALAVRAEVADLAAAGCRIVQVDE